jgi:hypothetical protein
VSGSKEGVYPSKRGRFRSFVEVAETPRARYLTTAVDGEVSWSAETRVFSGSVVAVTGERARVVIKSPHSRGIAIIRRADVTRESARIHAAIATM